MSIIDLLLLVLLVWLLLSLFGAPVGYSVGNPLGLVLLVILLLVLFRGHLGLRFGAHELHHLPRPAVAHVRTPPHSRQKPSPDITGREQRHARNSNF